MSAKPTRHQLRRHARKMRRSGLEPFMLVDKDDITPIAAIVLAKLLHRYRSELAPLFAGTLLAATGLILHDRSPHRWGIVLATALTVSAALLMLGRHTRLDRPAERAYAALAVTLAGAWLSAATANGPATRPLPVLLLCGGVIISVPWWAHRRRRAKVRVERTLAAWPRIAESIGLAGSRVMSAVVDLWGWRARLRLSRGQTVTDVINRIPAIESALGTRPGAVRVHPSTNRADTLELRVLEKNPNAEPLRWTGPATSTITGPIDLGLFETAETASVLLLRRHALIGGIAGSGKSGVLNVILGTLTTCPDVVLWGIDLKGGMELRPWASCLDRLATTPLEATALLQDATGVLEERTRTLSREGRRVWEPNSGRPALVIIIDEYAELAEEARKAIAAADSIARRGRAVAVTLLAATQRPTQNAMGKGAVRSQMDVRICLRVRERRDTDLILGQGAHSAGWRANTLDAPGAFYLSAPEHTQPCRARAYLLTDDDVSTAAQRHSGKPFSPVSTPSDAPEPDLPSTDDPPQDESSVGAEAALWVALNSAPDEGLTVAELMEATGMGRSWVYYRLQDHATAGRALQVSRGRWRSAE